MNIFNNYYIMEVANQSNVKCVDICEDNAFLGYYPQTELELKEPSKFSPVTMVATLGGKAALHPFKKGDLVAVRLSLWGNKENDEFVNHFYIDDIKLVKELDYLIL